MAPFKVTTDDGEKYLVMLTGARSYTVGGRKVMRHETLTVTERTRKYLLATGQFTDFDPTPPAPPERDLPPQFGIERAPKFDASDFDASNPPLSQEDAAALAGQGSEDFGGATEPVEEKAEGPKRSARRSIKVGGKASEDSLPASADKPDEDGATVIA